MSQKRKTKEEIVAEYLTGNYTYRELGIKYDIPFRSICDWEVLEIAHMSTSDGIGIELFSFPHGVKEAPEFNPFNTGLSHFCVQDPNIEELVEKIVSLGGKQHMPIRD